MIDLRSDTLTVPTPEMRACMAEAPVGDDVWGEDPTVIELQDYGAELFGKEAGLYVPSGVMGNQLALRVLCRDGDEVLIDSQAHIFYYEAAAPAVISRVQLRPLESEGGVLGNEVLEAARRPEDVHFPHTRLLCLENTHNRYGGVAIGLEEIQRMSNWARERGVKVHCDGARIWNACVATQASPAAMAAPFDTLSVCLSKGLGAPVGSLLLGSRADIDAAVKWRKILGGGMRQAGIIAAGGLYAMKQHFALLGADHKRARLFADSVQAATDEGVTVNYLSGKAQASTNIVLLKHDGRKSSQEILQYCSEREVLLSDMGGNTLRAVFHFQVSDSGGQTAAEVITAAFSG